jgi:hypothetical protein
MQSCKAQTQKKFFENNIKKDTMIYPIVTKDFETFNQFQYENRKDKNTSVLREFLEDGTYLEVDGLGDIKQSWETPKYSFFKISKYYYKNKNIKNKGLGFNSGGFPKGTWYEFDEKGNLIKEIDYDKNYKFTFEDILNFCEKENIRVDKGPILQSTGFHTRIYRDRPYLGKNNWGISWLKKVDIIEDIVIDGTTGKVLSRTDRGYENN